MKNYDLRLARDAVRDINDIYNYLAEHHSESDADYVLDRILDAIEDLRSYPNRGVCPKELALHGLQQFREIFFKPYRIIYSISGKRVHVLLIADGRRDFQTLLARRLLR